jgi:hypothetical protein
MAQLPIDDERLALETLDDQGGTAAVRPFDMQQHLLPACDGHWRDYRHVRVSHLLDHNVLHHTQLAGRRPAQRQSVSSTTLHSSLHDAATVRDGHTPKEQR